MAIAETSNQADVPAVTATNGADGGPAILGARETGKGVVGTSRTFQGVFGHSVDNSGIVGESDNGHAVVAVVQSENRFGVSVRANKIPG